MLIGNREFDTAGHCYVMGILNVTPDSFSDGGKWNNKDAALRHVEQMIGEGMDILDIGGESTRPGYTQISCEEEIERTAPIIEAVKNAFDIPVSLDTYKAEVALEGINAGADMINDIWGLNPNRTLTSLSADSVTSTSVSPMAKVISEAKVACCLMHNRCNSNYVNLIDDILSDLGGTIGAAHLAGIADDKIIIDPGVGFAKSYENDLEVIGKLEKIKELGFPVLLGCSRKSVIGRTLDLTKDERLEGTLATTVMAVMKGASFVRVHDVLPNVRAIKMTEAIIKSSCG